MRTRRGHFEGVFREARVWINGTELGGFDLPYLPFAFDVTEVLNADQGNLLVVRIDNRLDKSTLPCDTGFHPGKRGWFPYGVTTRQVYYFGFRDFEARDGTFFLIGEERFLHGINRHEDDPLRGPVFDNDFLARDIALMAELGVDFIRPGHYPNDEHGIFWLDRAGLLIAEEVPVYQLSEQQMADPVLVDRAVRALQRMIIRDFNRPGIVMWSIANENHCWAKTAAAFNQAMKDAARALDPDRPIMVVAAAYPE